MEFIKNISYTEKEKKLNLLKLNEEFPYLVPLNSYKIVSFCGQNFFCESKIKVGLRVLCHVLAANFELKLDILGFETKSSKNVLGTIHV